jgi:hypothetical protein
MYSRCIQVNLFITVKVASDALSKNISGALLFLSGYSIVT